MPCECVCIKQRRALYITEKGLRVADAFVEVFMYQRRACVYAPRVDACVLSGRDGALWCVRGLCSRCVESV